MCQVFISSDRVVPGSGTWPRPLQPEHLPPEAPQPPWAASSSPRPPSLLKMGMKCLNGVFCTPEQPGPPGPGRRDAAASAPLPDPRFPQRQLLLAPEIQGHILGVVHQRLRREPVSAQGPGEPRPARSARRPCRPYLLHPGPRLQARSWPREKGPGSGRPCAPGAGLPLATARGGCASPGTARETPGRPAPPCGPASGCPWPGPERPGGL